MLGAARAVRSADPPAPRAQASTTPTRSTSAVARLREERAIDDERVAEAIARTETAIRRRGKLRVRMQIERAGIATATAKQAIDEVFGAIDDDALLESALRKRLRGRDDIADDREFQRLYRYLVGQGFESDPRAAAAAPAASEIMTTSGALAQEIQARGFAFVPAESMQTLLSRADRSTISRRSATAGTTSLSIPTWRMAAAIAAGAMRSFRSLRVRSCGRRINLTIRRWSTTRYTVAWLDGSRRDPPRDRKGSTLQTIVRWCAQLFEGLEASVPAAWRVEVHQFRIEEAPRRWASDTPKA